MTDDESGWCEQCEGDTRPWCGHGRKPAPGPCNATVLIPLVTDGGEMSHAFPCRKRDGHDGLHLAHVEFPTATRYPKGPAVSTANLHLVLAEAIGRPECWCGRVRGHVGWLRCAEAEVRKCAAADRFPTGEDQL